MLGGNNDVSNMIFSNIVNYLEICGALKKGGVNKKLSSIFTTESRIDRNTQFIIDLTPEMHKQ